MATVEPPRSSDTPTDPAETIMHTMALRVDGNLAEAAAVCDAVSNEPVPVFDELGDPIRSLTRSTTCTSASRIYWSTVPMRLP